MNDTGPGSTRTPTSGRTVLVAGATGMLGREVAAALHRTGVRVTSLSRSPARAEALRGIADTIVLGDATRADTLRGTFDGVDAVVSCLGAPMAFTTGDRCSFRDLDTVANLNLIRAARTAGVRRFVYVSLLVRPAWSNTVYARAHEEVVEQLAGSGLSYGVVRPIPGADQRLCGPAGRPSSAGRSLHGALDQPLDQVRKRLTRVRVRRTMR